MKSNQTKNSKNKKSEKIVSKILRLTKKLKDQALYLK